MDPKRSEDSFFEAAYFLYSVVFRHYEDLIWTSAKLQPSFLIENR